MDDDDSGGVVNSEAVSAMSEAADELGSTVSDHRTGDVATSLVVHLTTGEVFSKKKLATSGQKTCAVAKKPS